MDCPTTQGCRIAKTLDSESPQWVRSRPLASTAHFVTSKVRDCSLEEEIGCEESTDADGSVSVQGKTQSPRRPFNSYYFSHRQSWLASVRQSFATRTGSLQDRQQQIKVVSHFPV